MGQGEQDCFWGPPLWKGFDHGCQRGSTLYYFSCAYCCFCLPPPLPPPFHWHQIPRLNPWLYVYWLSDDQGGSSSAPHRALTGDGGDRFVGRSLSWSPSHTDQVAHHHLPQQHTGSQKFLCHQLRHQEGGNKGLCHTSKLPHFEDQNSLGIDNGFHCQRYFAPRTYKVTDCTEAHQGERRNPDHMMTAPELPLTNGWKSTH